MRDTHRVARDLHFKKQAEDQTDRCDRCGKVLTRGKAKTVVDEKYDRTMRVDERCQKVLKYMAGYREVEL